MPSFRTTRRVRHAPNDMFELVADVEQYPRFLPLCQGLKVRRRATNDAGQEVILADMQVGYGAIRETFRHLENRWTFRPFPNTERACDVEFYIDYEFASRTLGLLMGSMFDTAFRKFAEAFEKRADFVYGRTALKAP